MSKKEVKLMTDDFDEAWKIYEIPVQCGDCYVFYDADKHKECPNCGRTEWVGSK